MKKVLSSLLVAMFVAVMVAGTALAAPGGMPAAHGVDGQTFGAVVSGAAQSAPGAIADHVSNNGGMPAAHGVDGQTFGSLVSGLAQSAPGAIAGHVSGR
jgi:acid phosphatase family membrane protein YuiD